MSNTIKLFAKLDDIGIFNEVVTFRSPIQLPKDTTVKMRVSRVQISDRIPNVFDARPHGVNFNNRTLRVGTNLLPYTTIILESGLYLTSAMLMAAINAALNSMGWWNIPNDPGFTISVNTVIDRFIIKINSTKLAPAVGTQFYMDLSEATTDSQLYRTLGFLPTTSFVADGTYTSPNVPQMETQGTSCVVCCSLMPPRLVNESYQPYVADVDFAGKLTASDNIWPPGNVGNDMIIYSGSRTISQATFYVLTDAGTQMVFMHGRLKIELLFYW